MDVAVHGGEHDLPFRVALGALEELLEMLDGALHHLRGLEHEREDELAGAELVPHLLHGGEEHLVEHADGILPHPGCIERVLDAVLLAVEDHPVDARIGTRPTVLGTRLLLGRLPGAECRVPLEVLDESLERVGAAVEHEIVRQRPRLVVDLGVGLHVRGVDDGHVEPGLHAVMQEHGIEHGARGGGEAEAHVAHA